MPRARQPKLAFVNENRHITITSLAADTVVIASASIALTEDFFMKSIDVMLQYSGGVSGDDVLIRIADSDWNTSQILALLSADGPTGRADKEAFELSDRNVRFVATIGFADAVPNNGLPIRVNVVSRFAESKGWVFFAYNASGSAISGTAGIVDVTSKAFGNWLGG